ncbi:MAG: hypothetical protein AAF429_09615 [Pseudomonadota bacterium]
MRSFAFGGLFSLFVAMPVFADALIWHMHGRCLIAQTQPQIHLSDPQGPQQLRLGDCTKEVRNTKGRFRQRLIWLAGDEVLIRAQMRDGSLEVFIDQEIALFSQSAILGFQDCFSIARGRGFLHICFQGPGPVIDGPSAAFPAPKGWQLREFGLE